MGAHRQVHSPRRLASWLTGLRPEAIWYPDAADGDARGRPLARWLGWPLIPLGWLWCAIAALRRLGYRRGWLTAAAVGVPVLVVGNLTVGGTGKTPLVLWLVAHLRERAKVSPPSVGRPPSHGSVGARGSPRRPGIVLRGHGAAGNRHARLVPADGDPTDYGDEPVLLARRAGCPVAIGRDRVAAARLLVAQGCDLIIGDDGLQHYRLHRDLEIVLVDGGRRFGNGRCLPAGPLREPVSRLRAADLVLIHGASASEEDRDRPAMQLVPGAAWNLAEPAQHRPLGAFLGGPVTAVAGIGNPQRFFTMLRGLGLPIDALPYPDHHRFTPADAVAWPSAPVLMTEKDAVKCRAFADPRYWAVPVDARPDERFVLALDRALDQLWGELPPDRSVA